MMKVTLSLVTMMFIDLREQCHPDDGIAAPGPTDEVDEIVNDTSLEFLSTPVRPNPFPLYRLLYLLTDLQGERRIVRRGADSPPAVCPAHFDTGSGA